jgi:hypothetical protein
LRAADGSQRIFSVAATFLTDLADRRVHLLRSALQHAHRVYRNAARRVMGIRQEVIDSD